MHHHHDQGLAKIKNIIAALDVGITEAQLTTLFRIKRGDGISGGNAGVALERKKLVTPWTNGSRELTLAGLVICERARSLGW